MLFLGFIKEGVLSAKNLKTWVQSKKDGKYSIEIKKVRQIRSLSQNALYWKWLDIIGNSLGYDADELHTTFKSMFLTDRSQKLPLVRSTAKLNKNQFSAYLGKIEREAAQLGIVLPQPEDYYNSLAKELNE